MRVREDISWWISNVMHSSKSFKNVLPTLEITTDASNTGWGGGVQGPKYWWTMDCRRSYLSY